MRSTSSFFTFKRSKRCDRSRILSNCRWASKSFLSSMASSNRRCFSAWAWRRCSAFCTFTSRRRRRRSSLSTSFCSCSRVSSANFSLQYRKILHRSKTKIKGKNKRLTLPADAVSQLLPLRVWPLVHAPSPAGGILRDPVVVFVDSDHSCVGFCRNPPEKKSKRAYNTTANQSINQSINQPTNH